MVTTVLETRSVDTCHFPHVVHVGNQRLGRMAITHFRSCLFLIVDKVVVESIEIPCPTHEWPVVDPVEQRALAYPGQSDQQQASALNELPTTLAQSDGIVEVVEQFAVLLVLHRNWLIGS
jgi:hypothetical protein